MLNIFRNQVITDRIANHLYSSPERHAELFVRHKTCSYSGLPVFWERLWSIKPVTSFWLWLKAPVATSYFRDEAVKRFRLCTQSVKYHRELEMAAKSNYLESLYLFRTCSLWYGEVRSAVQFGDWKVNPLCCPPDFRGSISIQCSRGLSQIFIRIFYLPQSLFFRPEGFDHSRCNYHGSFTGDVGWPSQILYPNGHTHQVQHMMMISN